MNSVRKKRGLPYDVVAVIADQLVAKGFKPNEISAGAIRDETGTGSLTTINNHLNDWRARERPALPAVTIDAENLTGVVAAVTALIEQASERVRNDCRTAAAGEAIEKSNLHAELEDALRVNEEIEAEREAMATEIDLLKTALDDAKLLVADLEGQIKGQARTLAVLERAMARTASASEREPAEQPADPVVTDAGASAAGAATLTAGLAETLLEQQRSAGDRGEDIGSVEEKASRATDADSAIGHVAETPLVPSDDAVQANVDPEDRG